MRTARYYATIGHMKKLMKNEMYESLITGYTAEGLGVCRAEGMAVFVKGALRGETWRVRIMKVAGSVAYGKGEECLSPSDQRTAPACPVYGKCGGCDCAHMTYAEELRFKRDKVTDALRRIGGLDTEACPIVPSDTTDSYRNKAIYNVAPGPDGPVFGFYRTGSHDVAATERCLLQSEGSDSCAAAVCAWMARHSVPAYTDKDGGAVRHVFVRRARRGGTVCCVVSAKGLGANTASLVSELREACPELTGIVLCVNRRSGNTVLAGDFHTLWGIADMTDTLCGFEYSIAPQAFYQINPPQAEKLYALAVDMAVPEKAGTVLDLYCGAGTISLCLSARAEKVIGAEIVPEAVENARANAARNGVGNAEFICADAGEAALELKRRGVTPNAVVVDPPRKGMSEEAVRAVAAMQPARIAYVSCDCATLARDLKLFGALGYRTAKAVPVDMFPRTCHVETVVLMSRAKE